VVTVAPQSSTVGEPSLEGVTTTDAFGHTVIVGNKSGGSLALSSPSQVPSSLLSSYHSSASSDSQSASSMSTSTLSSGSSKPTDLGNGAIDLKTQTWPGLCTAVIVAANGFFFF
jgi:hypothetical protein